MTAFAIGAATRPPVASLPRLPPSRTTTATAIVGCAAGANATNHACGFARSAVLRGSGLARDRHAGDLRRGAGPMVNHVDHHRGELGGGLRRDRLPELPRAERLHDHAPDASRTSVTEPRRHLDAAVRDRGRRPAPSASGSPRRSPARSPSTRAAAGCAVERRRRGRDLALGERQGRTGSARSNPYAWACATSVSAPRSSPIPPNTTLHETVSAWSSVICGAPLEARSRCRSSSACCVVCGRSSSCGFGYGVVRRRAGLERRGGRHELERRARRIQLLDRLRQQRLAGVRRDARPTRRSTTWCRARRAGSGRTTGSTPAASTSPVRGSIATTRARQSAERRGRGASLELGIDRRDRSSRRASAGPGSRRRGSAAAVPAASPDR